MPLPLLPRHRPEHPITPERRVELTVRDRLGTITTLITRDGAVDAATAAAEIAAGATRYVTGPDSWVRSPIKARRDLGGTYLFANWDGTGRNNLHELSWREATRPVAAVCAGRARRRRAGWMRGVRARGLWARFRGMVAARG